LIDSHIGYYNDATDEGRSTSSKDNNISILSKEIQEVARDKKSKFNKKSKLKDSDTESKNLSSSNQDL
jgi:hypothetical protein